MNNEGRDANSFNLLFVANLNKFMILSSIADFHNLVHEIRVRIFEQRSRRKRRKEGGWGKREKKIIIK